MPWAKPSCSLSGWSVTEVQGSEGCSYISNHCSWYEGRRSSYLLFKYREGACRVIISMHNKSGSSLGWPLDGWPSSSHHNCQTAALVSPAVFTQKRPCATFPSNIKNYFKEVVRRIKILAAIFTYTSLSGKKINQHYTKAIRGSRDKSKIWVFWRRKLQHVEMHFTSRVQSNLKIFCIF